MGFFGLGLWALEHRLMGLEMVLKGWCVGVLDEAVSVDGDGREWVVEMEEMVGWREEAVREREGGGKGVP